MKKQIYAIGFLCLFLVFSINIFAQSEFNSWEEINEYDIPKQSIKNINPTRAQHFNLQVEIFKNWLNNAPTERNTKVKQSNHILEVPTPNGTKESFKIVSYQMLEMALSTKYPEINNYYGVSLRNPSRTIRFDWTYRGFHAMVMGGNLDTYYIDPYQRDDLEYYQVYYKKDYPQFENNHFECGVKGSDEISEVSDNRLPGDCTFRTYRLAMATTGEYSNFHGATSATQSNLVLSEINTAMNRVNGIYERDIAVRMILIANTDNIFYYNPNTDPYTNNSGVTMLGENQTNIDNVIGSSNYDIGHVFSTGGGGVATLNSPCNNNTKARGVTGLPNPINDPFYVDYVAHEMGHQFGANHTQNNSCQRNLNTAMEPGSASTIMGYAGICTPNVQFNSDDYFHAVSIQEMMNNITSGTSSTCDTEIPQGNSAPTVSLIAGSYNIPNGTPFVLNANSDDPDGTAGHTYCWEQFDNEVATMPPVSTNTGGPAFRTFDPTTSSSRYFPSLATVPSGSTWEVLPSVARTMNFRVTVRDNADPEGCTAEADVVLSVDGVAGPFDVLSPVAGTAWIGNQTATVSWDIANTNMAPINCSNVDIMLSTDGGISYNTTIADDVPNTGMASITVPNINSSDARIMVKASDNVFFDINGGNFSLTASTNNCENIVCPNNLTVNNNPGLCGANVEFTITPPNNCNNPTITSTPASGDFFIIGITTVMVTSMDVDGNTSSCSFNVTVNDVEAPTAVCPNDIITNNDPGVCNANVNFTIPSATDNCSGVTQMANANPGTFTVGTTPVIVTATDASGNTSSCTFNITVNETEAPVMICNNLNLSLSNNLTTISPAQVDGGSTDNCGIVSLSLDNDTFTCDMLGSQNVILTATDASGNNSSCNATINVQDDAPPSAICSNPIINLTSDGTTTVDPTIFDGGSFANCGDLDYAASMIDFDCSDVGNTYNITLTVTAQSNSLSTTCTSIVTINDPNSYCCAPANAVCNDLTVTLDQDGLATILPTDVGLGSTAECGLIMESVSPNSFDCNDTESPVVVTYTITDINGASSTCTAFVTVEGLPCGFTNTNGIGCVGNNEASYDSGTFTITSDGCTPGFPYINDNISFVQHELCGDGYIKAYVDNVNGNGFAGIELRNSIAPNAKKISIGTDNINRIVRSARVLDGYPAWPQELLSYDKFWLKIERSGNIFKASASVDDIIYIPYLFQFIQMGDCLAAGMFVYSKNGGLVTADFTNVEVGSSTLSFESIPNGIAQITTTDANINFSISPNPATDNVLLTFDQLIDEPLTISVFDLAGRPVLSLEKDQINDFNESINIQSLSNGIYYIKLNTTSQQSTLKFIKN